MDTVNMLAIPDALDLARYWSEHPPVHLVLAAFAGVKPRAERPSEPTPSQEELDKLIAEFRYG